MDKEQAREILSTLRRREESAKRARAEQWDIPGVNCPLPDRTDGNGGPAGTGNTDFDAALAAVTAGAVVLNDTDDPQLAGEDAAQLLSEIATARNRLDAAYFRAIAMVDRLDAAETIGAGTHSTQGLVKALGATPGRAKADVRAARALHGERSTSRHSLDPSAGYTRGPLEKLGRLLADGEISVAHVDTAVRTLNKLPTEILDAAMAPATDEDDGSAASEGDDPADEAGQRLEPEIVRDRIADYFATTAPSTTPDNLQRLAKHLVDVLDPDTDDHFDPEAFARRSMTMSTDITGMVFGTYQLDPAAGARLKAILDPLSAPRPDQHDPDGTVVVRDDRTADQRRADALSELAQAASTLIADHDTGGRDNSDDANARESVTSETASPGDPVAAARALFAVGQPAAGDHGSKVADGAGRAAKLRPGRRPARITVVTTMDKLAGADSTPSQCDQTGQMSRGTMVRIGCDASFERLLMDAEGAVLDLGSSVRLATPAQKRAIAARDQGCVFPGCDRPPGWCDTHHATWYSRGGTTNVDNMCLLCEEHHTLIHTGKWEIAMIRGVPYARPGPDTLKLRANGRTAKIFGSYFADGAWVRNTYFDQLKDTENLAREITSGGPEAA